MTISCARVIARPPSEVYDYLADLRMHWPLLGDSLVRAVTSDSQEHSTLLVRVPVLRFTRRIDTRVDRFDAPRGLHGVARSGLTTAQIEWRITPAGVESGEQGMSSAPASEVRFNAKIEPGTALDRLLVRLSRRWLARRCEGVLLALAARLEPA